MRRGRGRFNRGSNWRGAQRGNFRGNFHNSSPRNTRNSQNTQLVTVQETSVENLSNTNKEQQSIDKNISGNNDTIIDISKPLIEDKEVEKNDTQEETEDKDKENSGKSTGLDKTNDKQSSDIIEPDNVQGSSPPANNIEANDQTLNESVELDQNKTAVNDDDNNSNECKLTSVEDEDNSNQEGVQSEIKDEAQGEKKEVDITSEIKNINENNEVATPSKDGDNIAQNEDKNDFFQSEYTQNKLSEASIETKTDTNSQETQKPEKKDITEEKTGKKRITLRRSPVQKIERPPSPLEDGEIQEPKEQSKKIVLKRRTTSDDGNLDFINKIVINRRSSEDENERKKRKNSEETAAAIKVEPPKQSVTVVKLIRNLSTEVLDSEGTQRFRKQTWGKSEFLENISSSLYKIDLDSIKIVCPSVEFLKESEINLEETPRGPPITESAAEKKNSHEKSEDESDKEGEETRDESSDEQKSEINHNVIAMNRKISIVEDTAAKLRPPPSPPANPVSQILYITNLVRPFTVKQLKELLERTGKIKEDGFWTDRIKSKCYAHYEKIEEAEATRNALHGVFWPIGNGKQLRIDYATEEDMKKARNPVPLPVVGTEKPLQDENSEPNSLQVRQRGRERISVKEERRDDESGRDRSKNKDERKRNYSRSRSRERIKKHSRRSYTPEERSRKKSKVEEDSVPQKLMDDLFLKTKTTPSIYWQPLSPQEIATKQQQRLVRMEEHKRRIQENRGRRERDRRPNFRRR